MHEKGFVVVAILLILYILCILYILYIAFYTQPGRIKAARKVGAGEAEALREKVKADFQGK